MPPASARPSCRPRQPLSQGPRAVAEGSACGGSGRGRACGTPRCSWCTTPFPSRSGATLDPSDAGSSLYSNLGPETVVPLVLSPRTSPTTRLICSNPSR
eukprot:15444931-Alexandrium_andersonii.AAC.1